MPHLCPMSWASAFLLFWLLLLLMKTLLWWHQLPIFPHLHIPPTKPFSPWNWS